MGTIIIENSGNFSMRRRYVFSDEEDSSWSSSSVPSISGNKKLAAVASGGEEKIYEVTSSLEKRSAAAVGSSSSRSSENSSNKKQQSLIQRFLKWLQCSLANIFLPYQYPESVSPDYWSYQVWDTCQAFFSGVANTFATEAVYKALGVGDAKATALAAATVILLQDASAWFGELVFGWLKGRAFDYNNKKWRFFADVTYDFFLCFKLTYPMFPSQFLLPVFCGAAFLKSFQSISGSSTRIGLVAHQARANNYADVMAKDGSQEQVSRISALVVSLVLLHAFSTNQLACWMIMLACAVCHVFCNVFAIRNINFASFNKPRLLHCLRDYLKHGKVPGVVRVNRMECIILGLGIEDIDVAKFRIKVGARLKKALLVKKTRSGNQTKMSSPVEQLLRDFAGKSFLIMTELEKNRMDIVLHENVEPIEMIEAYTRCVLVGYHFRTTKVLLSPMDPSITESWNLFRLQAQAEGFDLNQDLLAGDNWRARWKVMPKEMPQKQLLQIAIT